MGISGIIFNVISAGWMGLAYSLVGILIGGLVLELIARTGYLFADTRAMGEADTYVAGALGAMFGIQNILTVLLYALGASMMFIVPMFLYSQYKNNNKSVCILSVLFILSALVYKTLWPNYFVLGIFALIGIMLSIAILKNIKHEENRNYLPYVPALTAGALYFIFFNINF